MQPASRAMMVGANRRALHPSIRDSMSNDPKMICAGVCVESVQSFTLSSVGSGHCGQSLKLSQKNRQMLGMHV